ncbi:MAG: hypothetical protein K1X74_17335 [Pirellulales bacterium]|nr:hypothetical protein [Pirellulales bacterium]
MRTFTPDPMRDPLDLVLAVEARAQPIFDPVVADFLHQGYEDLLRRTAESAGLLSVRCFGNDVPWVYRFDFQTRSLGKQANGEIVPIAQHAIAVRFPGDCLRRAERFEMLRYLGPPQPAIWHPNICPQTGAVCLEIYPGESPLAIAESLHDLLRYRLRTFAEHDALNRDACAYGRTFVTSPTDERPLFGAADWTLHLETMESPR